MIQFAHVAGPGMLMKRFERRGIESGDVFAIALRVAVKEMVRQEIDVFAAVAQRRQVNLNGVQTEEQVLAKAAGSGFRIDVRVGCCQNPHVHAASGRGANTLKISGFQDAQQLCLQIQRKDRKSTRLNSSHANISYAVFCLKKKKNKK